MNEIKLNPFDRVYHDLLQDVLDNGRFKTDRTGVGCYSVFGRQVRFDLSKGYFPLLTTKYVSLITVARELLWFLSGDTNNNTLRQNKVSIWNAWAYKDSPEVMTKKYKWLKQNAPDFYHNAKVAINTVNGATYDDEQHLEKSLYVIDTLYRRAGGPVISPEHGSLGPVYGAMWRAWPEMIRVEVDTDQDFQVRKAELDKYEAAGYEYAGDNERGSYYFKRNIDQMQILIDNLKSNPFSRRHIVSGWNPVLLPDEKKSHRENVENGKQVLPPCHTMFQFFVEELTEEERLTWIRNQPYLEPNVEVIEEALEKAPKLRLSCQLFQRSADIFLGVPYNIASYSLLLMMVAQATGMVAGEFIHSFGDLHVYSNHLDQIKLQLSRESKDMPIVKLNPTVKDLFAFEIDDITIEHYEYHEAIKGPVAV